MHEPGLYKSGFLVAKRVANRVANKVAKRVAKRKRAALIHILDQEECSIMDS